MGIPVGRLFGAFAGEAERGRWLADAELRERSATKPRSARFDWGDGRTRVNVTFRATGEARSTVTVEHTRALVHQRADTTALKVGRAVHTAVFEPDRLLRDYVLWDGGDRRGKEWTAFKELHEGPQSDA